ncbi:response regulator transcription factor [Paraferrimonas sp. SM1919]|uniref:response regulator transcription factor n=1 Tax=Paraferrimonas sp. SM1919 TaxID=2662263 RepID=UPI0013D71876|nr:helix-turn-helix transcriptional regulator [Paraferrimonas sp. SM1919]
MPFDDLETASAIIIDAQTISRADIHLSNELINRLKPNCLSVIINADSTKGLENTLGRKVILKQNESETAILTILAEKVIQPNKNSDLKNLTQCEIETLKLISLGSTNKEIAMKKGITESTVKSHLYKCYKKIKVKNRNQASLWYRKNKTTE